MAFHFSLAAVLKLRESIEQQEYLNLEKIHQEIAHAQAEIAKSELRQGELQQDRDTQLPGSMPSIHLQSIFEQIFALEQRKDALKAALAELAIKKDQQLKIYNQARQKREVLESMRERQYTLYQREETKRQQALMDDLFLARLRRE
jgi:flagellar export protein FliJ